MKRREFITLLGGAAAAWPLAARAQQAGKVPTIGFLGADAAGWRPWTDAFVGQLRKLGWIEGRTIAIEYRWSQARPERAAEIAAEFVRLKVDLIVTSGTAVPTVLQFRSTRSVAAWSQVWRDRAATSLDYRSQQADIAGKRLELLREVVPRLRRVAIMVDVGFAEGVLEM